MNINNVTKYQLQVSDSVLSQVHGIYKTIPEYYIKDLNISFNFVDNEINCFTPSKTRYDKAFTDHKPYSIPTKVAKTLKAYIKAKNNLSIIIDWISKNREFP